LQDRPGIEIVADNPDEKTRGDQGRSNQNGQLFAGAVVSEQKEESKDHAQREERVNVIERHGRVERQLQPQRKRSAPGRSYGLSGTFRRIRQGRFARGRIESRAPLIEKKQSGGKGVEQTSLRDEHRQRNAFPGNRIVALVVLKDELLEHGKARHSTVEKESRNPEVAGPAVEGVAGSG
jgi:hypothetical protein